MIYLVDNFLSLETFRQKAARKADELHRETAPYVVSAQLISARQVLHVMLFNGVEMNVSVNLLQDLQKIFLNDLAKTEITFTEEWVSLTPF